MTMAKELDYYDVLDIAFWFLFIWGVLYIFECCTVVKGYSSVFCSDQAGTCILTSIPTTHAQPRSSRLSL
jgi:hypothetical protein